MPVDWPSPPPPSLPFDFSRLLFTLHSFIVRSPTRKTSPRFPFARAFPRAISQLPRRFLSPSSAPHFGIPPFLGPRCFLPIFMSTVCAVYPLCYFNLVFHLLRLTDLPRRNMYSQSPREKKREKERHTFMELFYRTELLIVYLSLLERLTMKEQKNR